MSNDDTQDKRLEARLNLSGGEEIKEWEKDIDYLEKKKKEARLAMESAVQREKREKEEQSRKEQEEQEKRKVLDIEKQKELEKKRKEEEKKRAEEAARKAEEERLARLEEVIKEKEKVNELKNRPSAELTPIKTFESDVASAIRKENLSSARIAIKEKDKTPFIIDETPQIYKTKNFVGLILITFFLLGAGGAGAYLWWQNQKADEVARITTFTHKPLIFADQSREISLTGKKPEQIWKEINDFTLSLEQEVTPGKDYIKEIYFTKATSTIFEEKRIEFKEEASFNEWVKSSNLKLPDDFSRFVEGPFMIGSYLGEVQGSFFILKTKNYANLADSLLRKETIIIPSLLSIFIGEEEAKKIAQNGFRDKIYRNLDTRNSKDLDNSTLAVWTFLDPETLVIIQNEEILGKVINTYTGGSSSR